MANFMGRFKPDRTKMSNAVLGGSIHRESDSFVGREMQVHRLYGDFARASKPVHHQIHAGENAHAQALKTGFHANTWLLVEPATWLYIDLFAGSEHLLKHIAKEYHRHS